MRWVSWGLIIGMNQSWFSINQVLWKPCFQYQDLPGRLPGCCMDFVVAMVPHQESSNLSFWFLLRMLILILGGGMQDIHILRCDERNLVVTPFIGAPIWFRVLDTPLTIPFSLPTTPLRLRHAPIVLRLHPTALLEDVQSAQKKHTAQLQRDLTFQLGRNPKSCFRFKHRSIRLVSQN